MIRSFFNITLRILWRNKVTSAINILSLSMGITAFLLILLYVHHETSYDKFNENYDRIYRLEGDEYARLPTIIGDDLRDKIPEIEHITLLQHSRIQNFINVDQNNPNKSVTIQTAVIRADSAIFNIFTLPFIQGNPKTALNEPFTIVLTESTTKKLFGGRSPIGETITLETQLQSNNEYKITGVIKDIKKSHINIDALLSIASAEGQRKHMDYNYSVSDRFWNGIYLLLADNADPDVIERKINDVLSEINDGSTISVVFRKFHLRALKDLYLNGSAVELEYSKRGNSNLIWAFVAIAIFILSLAIINYVNLTTARSTLRTKEITLKKVMGAANILLRSQFIIESTLITFIAIFLSLTKIQVLVSYFNQLTGVNISLVEYSTPFYWGLLLIILVIISCIAGFYPSMILTSSSSTSIVPRKSHAQSGGSNIRRILLIVQFSISIILIVGIITNLRQMQFVKDAGKGFNQDQVLMIYTPWNFNDQYLYRKSLKERLHQYQDIGKISFSNKRFGSQEPGQTSFEISGSEKHFQHFSIDPDYMDLMQVQIVEGRNFEWDRLSDRATDIGGNWADKLSVIINETAAQSYWDDSPVGKLYFFPKNRIQIEIIGVFKDFHFRSMHYEVEPMMLTWRDFRENIFVKVSSADMHSTIKTIEKEWKNVYGEEPFSYSFLDEVYEQQYTSDERAAKIIGYFTILAIFIACMGLFALSSFMAVRRTKEIGIRKALGASSKTIFVMLSREYIKWIMLSALIASPIAWFAMNKWLETFAYRIELGPGIFILAAILALTIGLITVGWQALKSANSNPVEALRYE